jgi:hypothetical protein
MKAAGITPTANRGNQPQSVIMMEEEIGGPP